jgi:hypothetical protein
MLGGRLCLLKTRKGLRKARDFAPSPYRRGHDSDSFHRRFHPLVPFSKPRLPGTRAHRPATGKLANAAGMLGRRPHMAGVRRGRPIMTTSAAQHRQFCPMPSHQSLILHNDAGDVTGPGLITSARWGNFREHTRVNFAERQGLRALASCREGRGRRI